ncbi:MAG: hypothetical protein LUF35_03510 [Lachnospiraceae bacterium]|nr:hypothetical protein [Lachnospiraceae bacterium]
MEDWLTRASDKAADKATAEATAKAAETLVTTVDSLMKNEGFSIERACRAINSTVAKYESAKKFLADSVEAV